MVVLAKLSEAERREYEISRCLKGWRVKILMLLENNGKLTTGELCMLTGIRHNHLARYADPLATLGFVRKSQEITPRGKTIVHVITDAGRELIEDLGK